MAVIFRIDVDRPYGKKDFFHKLASRIASDIYFPRIEGFNYLSELKIILKILNEHKVRSYIFFRKCTVPSSPAMKLIDDGGHIIGLHLENSRSLDTYLKELKDLEGRIGRKIATFSKHGSGKHKYGLHHYAAYEPEEYMTWAEKSRMKIFMGNLEDPTVLPEQRAESLLFLPSAFWLEPEWRDTRRFTPEWLVNESRTRDVVLLFHPDNVVVDPKLMEQFMYIIANSQSKVV